MSYGLTEQFGIAHGHAAALCLPLVWEHLSRYYKIPEILTEKRYNEFIARLTDLDMNYDFSSVNNTAAVAAKLTASVNTERLSNHPIPLSNKELTDMYLTILGS
jgi:alcohol dehydrogenase class IV